MASFESVFSWYSVVQKQTITKFSIYFQPFLFFTLLHKALTFLCFRYEMSNCLFEAAYEEILHRCNCTPSFHQTGIGEYPRICTGTKLLCMKTILQRIGKYNVVKPPLRITLIEQIFDAVLMVPLLYLLTLHVAAY